MNRLFAVSRFMSCKNNESRCDLSFSLRPRVLFPPNICVTDRIWPLLQVSAHVIHSSARLHAHPSIPGRQTRCILYNCFSNLTTQWPPSCNYTGVNSHSGDQQRKTGSDRGDDAKKETEEGEVNKREKGMRWQPGPSMFNAAFLFSC